MGEGYRCRSTYEIHDIQEKIQQLESSAYGNLAKDAMVEKIFEQDAEYPEVIHAYLRKQDKE